jgi:hypothetical protein
MGTRLLYWLAGLVAVGGVVGAAVVPWGKMTTCVEFAGCQTQNLGARLAVLLVGLVASGVIAGVAKARRNRWRRDARYWPSP